MRRYESFKRRDQQREEREHKQKMQEEQKRQEEEEKLLNTDIEVENSSKENEQPSCSHEEYKRLKEDYKVLTEDYQLRVTELNSLKKMKNLGRGFPDIEMLEGDDQLTSFYTGLPNIAIMQSVLTFVSSHLPTNPNAKLSNFQCFLLVLMKLRLGLSNYDLGYRFCIHETNVSRILTKWLQLMDIRLSPLIKWPDREQLKKTMPWCFRSQYGLKVTSIIDCFELFIEKPGDLMSKAATWSTYKHYNTAKYLISVTPQGTVSFISKGYGGRVSDKFITENSGYLAKLLPGDVVLADRGFNVEESIAYMGATLNIPSFTRGKSQLAPEDVESTRRLANVRIHVERIIGAMRQRFKLLSATQPLPTEYTRSKNGGPVLLDCIVRVCCALENVCESVVPST